MSPRYPTLYQINTRVWLTELSQTLGRPATLDDIPDAALERLAELGFDWIWLLSVWQIGLAGQQISRTNSDWRREFEHTLTDLREEDIAGSGFAITGYTVHTSLGGAAALARLRARLKKRGLRLMLDFVPNHTGLDHPWVQEHSEYYISGSATDLAQAPQNFIRLKDGLLLAHGRDPYFSGWSDTLQLDYSNPACQQAQIATLLEIADQCDGLRCDMAMLVIPEVFERTWGRPTPEFWPRAISAVRKRVPNFCFLAEVYWDLESAMHKRGFDYAYDKRLYDRLRDGHARPVREHLWAGLEYQDKLARFLENHDEPRAAATFSIEKHQAAALLTFLTPGLRFFHQGQLEGRRLRISPHLVRAPREPIDEPVVVFYQQLLKVLQLPVLRNGDWRLLECRSAWEGNPSADCMIAFSWRGSEGETLLVTVNYAPHASQCYLSLPFQELAARVFQLKDLLGQHKYERSGDSLHTPGLYLDLPAWGYHVFQISPR
jgi:hypothetical protein